jgi:hypothetical protein
MENLDLKTKLITWENYYGFTRDYLFNNLHMVTELILLDDEEKEALLTDEDYLWESFVGWCGDEFDGDYLERLELSIQ